MRWDGKTPARPREHLQGGMPLEPWVVIWRRFDGRMVAMGFAREGDAIEHLRKTLLGGSVAGLYEQRVNEHGEVNTPEKSGGFRPATKGAGYAH